MSPAPLAARPHAQERARRRRAIPEENTLPPESNTPAKEHVGIPAGRQSPRQKSPETIPARRTARKDWRLAPVESSAFHAGTARAKRTRRSTPDAQTIR